MINSNSKKTLISSKYNKKTQTISSKLPDFSTIITNEDECGRKFISNSKTTPTYHRVKTLGEGINEVK